MSLRIYYSVSSIFCPIHRLLPFVQVVWKRALLLGCGRTRVNGEPYYIAQMDIPGVIAGITVFDKSNVGRPKEILIHSFEFHEIAIASEVICSAIGDGQLTIMH